MTKRNWLQSFSFLLLAVGISLPAFAQQGAAQSVVTDTHIAPRLGAEGESVAAGTEEEKPWNYGGWLQFGQHTKSNGQFNNRPQNYNLHQAYVYLEKVADGSEGLDWGGRIDYVYGIDGPDTQAFGNTPGTWDTGWDNSGAPFGDGYGHAIPQLYGELALGDISLKVGHFYTLIGYEVVTAPDNFFYSHSFTMNNGEPFTHTGAIATSQMGDVTLYSGWVAGWDTGFASNKGSAILSGASMSLGDAVTATYVNLIGRIGNGTDNNGYNHSIVLDFHLTEKLTYIFQTDLVDYNSPSNTFADRRAVGVNQYFLYSLTDNWGVGTRAEWWRTEIAPGNNADLLETTVGVNGKIGDHVIVRAEARWNKDNDGFIIPAANNQDLIFGTDLILTY